MASLTDVLDAIGIAVTNAINAATPAITAPAQVFKGWPTAADLAPIIAAKQYQITLYARHAKRFTRYPPIPQVVVNTPATLIATVALNASNAVITWTGSVTAGQAIHTMVHDPEFDALVIPVGGDTPNSVAAKVAAAVNALGIAGLSASSSTNTTTITGTTFARVNISASNTMLQEVARLKRDVQCTIWASDPTQRAQVEQAIIGNVGGAHAPFLTAATDGSSILCLLQDSFWNDDAESSYSTFRSDIFFEVEYPIVLQVQGTQIGAVEAISVQNNHAPVTAYIG